MIDDLAINFVSIPFRTLCHFSLRIALAQLNPTVGDLEGNVAKIVAAYDAAEAAGCDIVAFTGMNELNVGDWIDVIVSPRVCRLPHVRRPSKS